jgi:mannose-6-phosphate isomerase-like protein (cupin superfamily)
MKENIFWIMNMKIFKIDDMKGGWFVGDFEPSTFKNPFFEVAHHQHKKGKGKPHVHKVTTELTYIIEGEMLVSGQHLKSGDMWIYDKNEVADVENLTNVSLIVVSWPSVHSDKYLV